uniref:Uncharacterized protein n=1 Tax=Sphaerodactylus townsendi TaxID=933632 RepID=A0ACB8GF72_9SAUR
MDRAPMDTYITTRHHVDYKPVMKVVTEEIGMSTIHGTTRDQAALPATEEDECLVNLGAPHPGLPSVDTGEGEDVLDEPPDPPDPPGATSSRHGDVETPDEDLDAFTLQAQHEALQRAKRDWQQAREALIDDQVHQQLQLHQEFEREREALYLQLQKDREQQERELLQAAEQSKQELLRELQHL